MTNNRAKNYTFETKTRPAAAFVSEAYFFAAYFFAAVIT